MNQKAVIVCCLSSAAATSMTTGDDNSVKSKRALGGCVDPSPSDSELVAVALDDAVTTAERLNADGRFGSDDEEECCVGRSIWSALSSTVVNCCNPTEVDDSYAGQALTKRGGSTIDVAVNVAVGILNSKVSPSIVWNFTVLPSVTRGIVKATLYGGGGEVNIMIDPDLDVVMTAAADGDSMSSRILQHRLHL